MALRNDIENKIRVALTTEFGYQPKVTVTQDGTVFVARIEGIVIDNEREPLHGRPIPLGGPGRVSLEDVAVGERFASDVVSLEDRQELARRLRCTVEQVDERLALDVARERAEARGKEPPIDDLDAEARRRGMTRSEFREFLHRNAGPARRTA